MNTDRGISVIPLYMLPLYLFITHHRKRNEPGDPGSLVCPLQMRIWGEELLHADMAEMRNRNYHIRR
jgi:hypothetical protein